MFGVHAWDGIVVKTSGIGPQALTNSECCLGIKAVLHGKDLNALDRLQNKPFIPESKVKVLYN
jgi:hypothetical protein